MTRAGVPRAGKARVGKARVSKAPVGKARVWRQGARSCLTHLWQMPSPRYGKRATARVAATTNTNSLPVLRAVHAAGKFLNGYLEGKALPASYYPEGWTVFDALDHASIYRFFDPCFVRNGGQRECYTAAQDYHQVCIKRVFGCGTSMFRLSDPCFVRKEGRKECYTAAQDYNQACLRTQHDAYNSCVLLQQG